MYRHHWALTQFGGLTSKMMGSRLVAVVGLSVIVAAACSNGTSSSGSGNQKLVWAWNFAPTAAWALETDDASYLTQAGVIEPLVRVGVDGSLGPGLATSWKRVDPLTWDFTLRHGVKFQDGSQFDAAAVVNSLNYVLQSKTPPRALKPTDITSVKSTASDTVRIQTAAPNPIVPIELSTAQSSILSSAAYIGGDRTNPINTGTGPFVMTASNLPQGITLKANPNYWGGPVKLATAEVRYIPDGQTRVSLAQTGEVQLASTLPASSVSTLKGISTVTILNQSIPRFGALYINNKRAPFTDVRVRQAIQSAIDVNAIANNVLQGADTAAPGPFRKDDAWAPKDATVVAQDAAKAKALLSAAGVDPSKMNITILAYSDRSELPITATAVQGMLSAVGINAKIKVATYDALEPDMLSGNYDLALVSRNYLFYAPDPLSFLQSDYTCSGNYNISQFCDPTVDGMVARAAGLDDAKARYAIYAQVADVLQKNAVDVFLFDQLEIEAASKNLKGFQIYSTEEYYLTPQMWFGG